jgi:hypothetical protein
MTDINTVAKDIYELFNNPDKFDTTREHIEEFAENLAKHLAERSEETRVEKNGQALRASSVGKPCSRQLWYANNIEQFNHEPLPPYKKLSFLYGDVIEELLFYLAKLTGHRVEGQQGEARLEGILGHRDGIIDGRLVDVKSASTRSLKKFTEHNLVKDDPFGYLGQLAFYLEAAQDDPLVTDKDQASFLVMDKQHGHLVLDTYHRDELPNIYELIERQKQHMASSTPPPRGFSPVPTESAYRLEQGAKPSGNKKLGVACSYCPVKNHCWPNMRTFVYSSGPVFMTDVVKTPRVPEVFANARTYI